MNELYEFFRIALLFTGFRPVPRRRPRPRGLHDSGLCLGPLQRLQGPPQEAARNRGRRRTRTGDHSPLRPRPQLAQRRRGLLRVGLDDIAHKILAGVTRVELPAPGTRFEKGETLATIECGEKRCKIAAPVSGTVTGVNNALAEDPKWILREPYMKGWLFSVKPDGVDYQKLPTGNDARTWFRSESHRLSGSLTTELGLAAAVANSSPPPATRQVEPPPIPS